MKQRGKLLAVLGALSCALLLGALEGPAHAALGDTLATATSVQYVWDHPKPGNVTSRRVVVSVVAGTPGGSVQVQKWDPNTTNWLVEDGPVDETTDVALDATITTKRALADSLNAAELAAALLTDSAAVVITGLTNQGAPTPTQAQLEAAMNPGAGGQTVFDLVRK